MSGPDWKHYLNGGTSHYNFKYNSSLTPSMPVVASQVAPPLTPTPVASATPSPLQQPSQPPKKKNQTGGKRKRRHLKRKTMKRK
jgi:hypothetical protein